MGRTFECPDCGNAVSKKAVACPKCGRVLKKQARHYGCGTLLLLGLLAFLCFSVFKAARNPSEKHEQVATQRQEPVHQQSPDEPLAVASPGDLFAPGDSVWITNVPEAKIAVVEGKSGFLHIPNPTAAKVIRKIPGAAPSQFTLYEVDLTESEYAGQRVTAGQGTMTKDLSVRPVHEQFPEPKPGDDPRFPVANAFVQVRRPAKDGLPSYVVLFSGYILRGGQYSGQYGSVMIPSVSRARPASDRESMARKIMDAEKMTEITMYSSEQAYRADRSASYAAEHPKSYKFGFLGAVRDGKFSD